ncbi:hypothetical protein [Stenotrophomonas sp. SORGH_AS_0321]|uniref:immunity protein Imm33 domain-containing protein n=1 Tax=Stenotrophomonas sp. SORGH_AS_0321 TaxID=3041787 RepID=UPI002861F369|nr:hypothetical protein [Stenotrophomonas sp. SORGH_AS_0321]MDR6095147.1 hypothetical protein [Stenotrophomonas sp. SORGH_AS_0321]
MQDPDVVQQSDVCKRYGAEIDMPEAESKLGLTPSAACGVLPIHGLRHLPRGDASGWYVWSGDYSEDPDFFEPLRVNHALSSAMVFARYLALPPGWRFLIGADGYEDVWYDASLLATE